MRQLNKKTEIVEDLIEHVIFWEKHTEIHDSLEKFLNDRYVIKEKDPRENTKISHTRALIDVFISKGIGMSELDSYRNMSLEIEEKFNISKNGNKDL